MITAGDILQWLVAGGILYLFYFMGKKIYNKHFKGDSE